MKEEESILEDDLTRRKMMGLLVGVINLGLIGSEHKAKVFLARLLEGGGAPEGGWEKAWDERMHCPVGLPLRSKNPKVIAVAAAAELLQEWGLAGEDS